jgi:hypothetical protein
MVTWFLRRSDITEENTRITYAVALTALPGAGPALGQVVIQTPNYDSQRHENRAMQDRSNAQMERQEAQRRAAMGDYQGAAEARHDARRDWRDARRQDERAREDSGDGVIGR